VIVWFVDIGAVDVNHYLNFLLIIFSNSIVGIDNNDIKTDLNKTFQSDINQIQF
jgi:hypothetical protein